MLSSFYGSVIQSLFNFRNSAPRSEQKLYRFLKTKLNIQDSSESSLTLNNCPIPRTLERSLKGATWNWVNVQRTYIILSFCCCCCCWQTNTDNLLKWSSSVCARLSAYGVKFLVLLSVVTGHEISFNFTAGFDGRESNQRGISELSMFIISVDEHRSIWERKQTCGLPTQHFIRDTYQVSKQRSVIIMILIIMSSSIIL